MEPNCHVCVCVCVCVCAVVSGYVLYGHVHILTSSDVRPLLILWSVATIYSSKLVIECVSTINHREAQGMLPQLV